MKIKLSLALAVVSSLSGYACSDRADSAASTLPSASLPSQGPSMAVAPQGRSAHHPAPSARVSSFGGTTFGGLRVLTYDGVDAGTDGGTDTTSVDCTAGPTTVSTDKTTYAYGEPITITFCNMPGNVKDWIDIAPALSNEFAYAWDAYTYTLGTSAKVTTYAGDFLPPGSYVVRAFPNDTYQELAHSATFTVGDKPNLTATVSIDRDSDGGTATYGGFDPITVTFENATPDARVLVSIHQPYGSTDSMFGGAYVKADTNGGGTVSLGGTVAGDFEVRLFEGTSWKGTSPTFHVNPAVKTDRSTYSAGANVRVDFAAMQALTVNDTVALAHAGDPDDAYIAGTSVTADWYWAGSRTVGTAGLEPGDYVARIFFDFSTTQKAESAVFTITP